MAAERHRQYFNRRASEWDSGITLESRMLLSSILDSLRIGEGSRVLDVGAGSGVAVPMISRLSGPRGTVTLLDIAESMLEEAKKCYAGNENICFVHSDIHSSGLPGASFDTVLCNSSFSHFTDKKAALHEIARLLQPGGLLAICYMMNRGKLNELHRGCGKPVDGDWMPHERDLRQALRQAGFDSVTVHESVNSYLLEARRGTGTL